jgi:hypothetical protein
MWDYVALMNNNKVLWGITMVLMNIGSRYVIADLGKIHDSILATEFVKKLIIFSIFFVATRDILTAFMLTVSYVFLVDGILHEKRRFCIIPKKYIKENEKKISKEEYLRAKSIVNKYENPSSVVQEEIVGETKQNINLFNIYKENLSQLS